MHAFLMTNLENGAIPGVIKTEDGFMSYTTIDEKIHLMLFGKTEKMSSERVEKFAQSILYCIRNMLIFTIGVPDI